MDRYEPCLGSWAFDMKMGFTHIGATVLVCD